ncbi:MAG TPA: N-6 DNA methylase, partial [Anaerolineae bacterium]
MPDKQQTFGQFETPPDVADLLLGFCLRRPSDRLLDPSCGTGAFLQRAAQWQVWLADNPAAAPAESLWGVELDADRAAEASTKLPHARIISQNFFTLRPDAQWPFDAIIGNPPYTRAEWIARVQQEAGQQLSMFGDAEPSQDGSGRGKQALIPAGLWTQLNGRSGLYAYFFLHGVDFLREGGRFGFVVPNGWLDVAYGRQLKQFLLDHFKIVALIESSVERWFAEASVNTCLIVLEKCNTPAERATNLVRLVRLRRPLHQLIAYAPGDSRRQAQVERLVTRLLPADSRQTEDAAVRVLAQAELDAAARWGLALRAPAVYRQRRPQDTMPALASWATIQRGFTTGANKFFYLDAATVEKWGIEPQFRRPLLKSLRNVDCLHLSRADCYHYVFWAPATADLHGTVAGEYVAWGESQGFHLRRTCAARYPWYSLPAQPVAQLVLPKGIWQRHFVPLLDDHLLVDQQLYQLRLADDVPTVAAAAALLNSSWTALQCELLG